MFPNDIFVFSASENCGNICACRASKRYRDLSLEALNVPSEDIDFIVKKLGADFVEEHLNNYIALYRNYLSKSYFPQNENLELIKNHASRLDPISKKKILKHIKTSQDSYDKIIDIMCEPLEYNFKRCISRNKNLKIK